MLPTLASDLIHGNFNQLQAGLKDLETAEVALRALKVNQHLTAQSTKEREASDSIQLLLMGVLQPLNLIEVAWMQKKDSLVYGAESRELLCFLKPFLASVDNHAGLISKLRQLMATGHLPFPEPQEALKQLDEAFRRIRQVSEEVRPLVIRLEKPPRPVDPEKLKPSGKPGKTLQEVMAEANRRRGIASEGG